MQIPVRIEGLDNKLSFVWDTDNDVFEIVCKKEIVQVQITKEGNCGHGPFVFDRGKRSGNTFCSRGNFIGLV